MKKLLIVFLSISLMGFTQGAEPTFSDDETAIRQVIKDYLWGMQYGDQEKLARAFDLEIGDMTWISTASGTPTMRQISLAEFRDGLDEPVDVGYGGAILAMDIVDGKMAWVKFSLTEEADEYIDYLMLLKDGDDWKIVNKMFVYRPGSAE